MIRSLTLAICCCFWALTGGCSRPTGMDSTTSTTGDADANNGHLLFNRRQFAEAVPLLLAATNKPLQAFQKTNVLTVLGNCYNELGDYAKALDCHEKALKADPRNDRAYVNKGNVYRRMENFDKVNECYDQARILNPDNAELHAGMGDLYLFQGKFDKAVEHLERSVKLEPTLAVAHANLALAYASVDRFDDAEKELKSAVSWDYHQPDVIKERIEQLRKRSRSAN